MSFFQIFFRTKTPNTAPQSDARLAHAFFLRNSRALHTAAAGLNRYKSVMKNYAVFLMGEDFMLPNNGSKELCGFFITVRVEADTEDEAGAAVLEVLKEDPQLADAFKAGSPKTPRIEVRVLHELLPENKMKNTEYTFFPMEEA
jgi:hypothetical protein